MAVAASLTEIPISVAKARDFVEGDFEDVMRWFKLRGWPQLPLSMFPQTGAIVEGQAAGFLYRTDSAVGWIEWVVSNPEERHDGAVEAVLNHLLEKAKELGMEVILSTLKTPSQVAKYLKVGFEATDTCMTNVIRRL
jgi:hypothetical protein